MPKAAIHECTLEKAKGDSKIHLVYCGANWIEENVFRTAGTTT